MSSLICPDLRHSPDLTSRIIANLVDGNNLSKATYETAEKLLNGLIEMDWFMGNTITGKFHREYKHENTPDLSERAFNQAIEKANSTLSEASDRLSRV